MPGTITPANPTEVMPATLCAAFTEELRIESFQNTYQDGSSDRVALALHPRRFFRMTRKVKASEYTTLYTFYKAHLIIPFWFYNLVETVPKFTWDQTGQAPDGRYAVVFDGSWSDQVILGTRSQVSLGLREVA
jgi:hypothetical protein